MLFSIFRAKPKEEDSEEEDYELSFEQAQAIQQIYEEASVFTLIFSPENQVFASSYLNDDVDNKHIVTFLVDIAKTETGQMFMDSLISLATKSPEKGPVVKKILTEVVEKSRLFDRPAVSPRQVFDDAE